jgi:hypothetical protein
MSWDRPFRVLVSAAAIAALAACAGGTSNIAPTASVGTSNDAIAPPQGLQATAAPASRFNQIEAQARPDAVGPTPSPSPTEDPLTNWQLLEPLYVSTNMTFGVPPWVRQCATISPLQGLWFVALFNFSTSLSQFDLPECTIPSPSPSQWFTKVRPNAILPSTRLYVVEFDVSLFSITSTPIASESPTSSGEFVMQPLQSTITFQRDHLYAFFLGEWLNAPPAVTESI